MAASEAFAKSQADDLFQFELSKGSSRPAAMQAALAIYQALGGKDATLFARVSGSSIIKKDEETAQAKALVAFQESTQAGESPEDAASKARGEYFAHGGEQARFLKRIHEMSKPVSKQDKEKAALKALLSAAKQGADKLLSEEEEEAELDAEEDEIEEEAMAAAEEAMDESDNEGLAPYDSAAYALGAYVDAGGSDPNIIWQFQEGMGLVPSGEMDDVTIDRLFEFGVIPGAYED